MASDEKKALQQQISELSSRVYQIEQEERAQEQAEREAANKKREEEWEVKERVHKAGHTYFMLSEGPGKTGTEVVVSCPTGAPRALFKVYPLTGEGLGYCGITKQGVWRCPGCDREVDLGE